MHYVTPDLCDAYPDVLVLEPMFSNFGGHDSFGGQIVTVKCFEDNSVVKEQVDLDGRGKVMVVDGGGSGSAPDAASYMAAGIAFCFMTQQGRYASIVKKDLSAYRVVQDLHLSSGVSGGDAGIGVADAVETHVYVETAEDDAFARQSLDMAEQTCFLHALCRTPLEPTVSITRLSP